MTGDNGDKKKAIIDAARKVDTDLKCAACGHEARARIFLNRFQRECPDGMFGASLSGRNALCHTCWNKKFFVCRYSGETHLRKNAAEVDIEGHKRLVAAKYTREFECWLTKRKLRVLSGHNPPGLIYIASTMDEVRAGGGGITGSDAEHLIYRGDRISCLETCGLAVRSNGSRVSENGLSTSEMLAEDGTAWVRLTRHGDFIARLDDCIPTEDGGWVHRAEAKSFTRTCRVTKKKFISFEHGDISREGAAIMKERGYVMCCVTGEPCAPGSYIIDSRGRVISRAAFDGGKIGAAYYDGSDMPEGTGRTIGIELELEVPPEQQFRVFNIKSLGDARFINGKDCMGQRVSLPTPPVSAHEDGSLRGSHPVEYVSPILHESNYEWWVRSICDAIKGSGVYSRAGYHLHLGSKDFSWTDLLRFGAFAQHNERFFYGCVAPTRTNNQFVTPLPNFIAAVNAIRTRAEYMTWMYGRPNLGRRDAKQRRAGEMGNHSFDGGVVHRYQWINFHSHTFRRTIEVRLHHATCNYDKITKWARMWLSIFSHFKNGGRWDVDVLSVLPSDLAKHYKARYGTFSKMLENTYGAYAEPQRSVGLLSNMEAFRRIAAGDDGARSVVGPTPSFFASLSMSLRTNGSYRMVMSDDLALLLAHRTAASLLNFPTTMSVRRARGQLEVTWAASIRSGHRSIYVLADGTELDLDTVIGARREGRLVGPQTTPQGAPPPGLARVVSSINRTRLDRPSEIPAPVATPEPPAPQWDEPATINWTQVIRENRILRERHVDDNSWVTFTTTTTS